MKKRLLLMLMVAMSCLQAMALSTTNFVGNNYFEAWGRLKLVATPNSGSNKVQLADKNGKAVQLRGWTTHGYQWASVRPFFDQKNDFEAMKNMGANVVRLTCYVNNGEIDASNWGNQKTWLKNAIQWTSELGMYAIVDYHVLPTNNRGADPNDYLNSTSVACQTADSFFDEISAFVKTNSYKHVMYEICNEPGQIAWNRIKTYAGVILPKIAANDPDAVVIIGTPQWSQLINQANSDKITHNTLQIMYTFHFYACSHGQFLSSDFTDQILRSIPVFATEWNDSNANGRGPSCGTSPTSNAKNFIDRCNNTATQRVSWTAWSWSPVEWENGADRVSSSWKNGTNANGNSYTVDNLSPTGKMIYDFLHKDFINYETCANSVKVTFQTDAGATQVAAQDICSGSKVFKPANPRKDGFTFVRWTDGGNTFDFNSAVTSNKTLVAEWKEGEGNTLLCDGETDLTNLCTVWYSGKDDKSGGIDASVPKDKDGNIIPSAGGNPGNCINVSYKTAVTGGTSDPNYKNWGCMIGFSLSPLTTEAEKVPVDITGALSISFDYKASLPVVVQIQVDGIAGEYELSIPAATSWKSVNLVFEDFVRSDWSTDPATLYPWEPGNLASVTDFAFSFKSASTAQSGTFSVDNIKLVGKALETCSSTKCTNEVTVTFDTDGGSKAPAVQTLCADNEETVEIPADPEKAGFDFVGWFNGNEEFNFTVAPTANVDLVAHWVVRTCTEYTVTFNSNGGSEVAAKTVCVGTSIDEPAAPGFAGYTFAGWFNGDEQVSFPYLVTVNVELTAKWEENVDPHSPTIIADCEADSTLLHTYWFGYADNLGSTFTPPDSDDPYAAEFPMYYGSDAHNGNGSMEVTFDLAASNPPDYTVWGAGVGFNLNADETPYNLDGSTGISFWINSSRAIVVQIKTGDCKGDDTYTYEGTLTNSNGVWKEVVLSWESFTVPSWNTAMAAYAPEYPDASKIIAIQWQASSAATAISTVLMLDDITVDGLRLDLPKPGATVDLPTLESASFAIYPNPAKEGNFKVALEGSDSAVLSIMNLQGQVVYNAAVNNGAAVNANLGVGVYVVSVKTANSVQNQKLIVK